MLPSLIIYFFFVGVIRLSRRLWRFLCRLGFCCTVLFTLLPFLIHPSVATGNSLLFSPFGQIVIATIHFYSSMPVWCLLSMLTFHSTSDLANLTSSSLDSLIAVPFSKIKFVLWDLWSCSSKKRICSIHLKWIFYTKSFRNSSTLTWIFIFCQCLLNRAMA